jgi:hypothetical protein
MSDVFQPSALLCRMAFAPAESAYAPFIIERKAATWPGAPGLDIEAWENTNQALSLNQPTP